MALRKAIDTNYGLTLSAAYIMVENAQYLKGEDSYARVAVYADQAARTADKTPINAFTIKFNYDVSSTQNIVTQAYNFIKTLPDYAGAVDV